MKLKGVALLACLLLNAGMSLGSEYDLDMYKTDYEVLFPVIVEYDQKCFRGDGESCKVSSAILGQLNRSLSQIEKANSGMISFEMLSTSLNGYINSRKTKLGVTN